MSKPKEPLPAKLIFSIIFNPTDERLEAAVTDLEERFGPVDYRSPILAFDATDYYYREMGEKLSRQFISIKELVGRERLALIKHGAYEIEEKHLRGDGNRSVNIDPGLLSLENLVLATGKNFNHRIYLGQGIFAEVTLMYRHGAFIPLPWTYPDYASAEIGKILTAIRKQLALDLKKKDAMQM